MSAHSRRKPADDFLTPQDREILERTFDIDDPAQLTGLLDRPPDTDEVPEIEYAYNITPPGGRAKGHAPTLKCVFPHTARHWRGSIVRWKNGDRARLGPDCGADHFGFNFKAVEERFVAAKSRKNDLVRFVALRSLLPKVVDELRPLSKAPCIVTYDELRQSFSAIFPELHQTLGTIAHGDGLLRTTRQERDRTAEENRVEKSKEGRELLKACEDARSKGPGVVKACNRRLKQWMDDQSPIMKTVIQEAGALSGRSFFTDPRPMVHTVGTATVTMAKLAAEITSKRSDHWTATSPFSRTFKSIRDAIALIDAVGDRIEDGRRFSSQANLQRITQWASFEMHAPRPRVRNAVSTQGRTLINVEGGARWSFAADITLPALHQLDELRRLMGN